MNGNADGAGARRARKSPSAQIRELIQSGQTGRAAAGAADLVAETFGLPVASVDLTLDEYSLNSVSGRVHFTDGHTEFFKFHQEDGEEAVVTEYYRAQLLEDAGIPVEMPSRVAGEPGRQIALYELRTEPRMADVCLALERTGDPLPPELAAARRALDRSIGAVALNTLRPGSAASLNSAVHQLFYWRLADAAGRFPGGRYQAWYPTDSLYTGIADHRFVVNNIEYSATLRSSP